MQYDELNHTVTALREKSESWPAIGLVESIDLSNEAYRLAKANGYQWCYKEKRLVPIQSQHNVA